MTAPTHPIFVALGSTPAQVAAGVPTSILTTSAGAPVFGATDAGGLLVMNTDASGTPGAATINKPSGKVAIALGVASVVVTNSLVTANSTILAVVQSADATLTFIKSVVPTTGSFTITGNAAATANCKVAFFVFN